MASKWLYVFVVCLILFVSLEAAVVDGQGIGDGKEGQGQGNRNDQGNNGDNGQGNKGEGNGNGNDNGQGNGRGNDNDKNNGKGSDNNDKKGDKKKLSPPPPPPSPLPIHPPPPPKDDVTDYYMLSPIERTGQQRAFCEAKGACFWKTLTCPPECPNRKPKKKKKVKGCFIDCSRKCEATCKWRKPKCNGYGSLCYDPRFVGGDGVMFYFHGAKGGDFAIVSDDNLQINAHFIGTRPKGRTRDFTWVQALSVMFDVHTLVLAAKRVSKWDDKVDALIVKWDDKMINIPTDGDAEWRINTGKRAVIVERTDDLNTIRVTVFGLVEMDIRVTPIGEKENKAHDYQIPADDAFSHLETQFKFYRLSDFVEGVLGKTYQPGYVSPVKIGVPMPMVGGEDKYRTPSLNSPLCKLCRFQRPSSVVATI
ncbi:hypothetical protein ACH5RR_009907 [Cinchona calisaya]|uniref:Root cap n=1 Tax=Cinchona calisaya TaxID=153742 RepID=A0ABD3AFI0_9GENT